MVKAVSEPHVSQTPSDEPEPAEDTSAVFAHLVLQQSNLALLFLGKTPHPETGEVVQDLETARQFISQLEMLEAKTKGNLSRDEEKLLKQSLMSLRLAFVDAVESARPPATGRATQMAPAAEAAQAAQSSPPSPPPAAPASGEEEPRKKFTKKY